MLSILYLLRFIVASGERSKFESDLFAFPPYEIIVNTSLKVDDYRYFGDFPGILLAEKAYF